VLKRVYPSLHAPGASLAGRASSGRRPGHLTILECRFNKTPHHHLGGEADVIFDVALIHEFGGNHMADV
jgi:hypothetical protein